MARWFRAFACHLCGWTFSTERALKSHLATEHGET